ncbi:hypothetical protein [Coralliovum pocilloporae]|uniref:hypothetical protein n=1 Tax=Coralliovum pocilloporae TaxID=3066369 RepID=UPI003307A054
MSFSLSSTMSLFNLLSSAIGLVQDGSGGVSALSKLLSKQKQEQLNTKIRELYFVPTGMLGTLRKLEKSPKVELVEVLRSQYEDSREATHTALVEIRTFFEEVGRESLRQYDQLIEITDGFLGKDAIRSEIRMILDDPSMLEHPLNRDGFLDEVRRLIVKIEAFNEALIVFHDRRLISRHDV